MHCSLPLGACLSVFFQKIAFFTLTPITPHRIDADLRANSHVFFCTFINVQTVGLLSVSVALPVIAVAGVTGADHSAKMVSTLLLTGGASTHVVVFRNALAQDKLEALATLLSVTRGDLPSRLHAGVLCCGNVIFRAVFTVTGILFLVGPKQTS